MSLHSAGRWILDVAHHLALPLATLILAYFPGNFLLTRGSMVMVLKEQFMETARAKGLPPLRIRYAHAARNALLPMVTRFGLRIAFMVTGALVVETIYAYPGLGTLLFNAISMRDLPLIQGIVLFSSLDGSLRQSGPGVDLRLDRPPGEACILTYAEHLTKDPWFVIGAGLALLLAVPGRWPVHGWPCTILMT